MAGRGRDMTLPSWMTDQARNGESASGAPYNGYNAPAATGYGYGAPAYPPARNPAEEKGYGYGAPRGATSYRDHEPVAPRAPTRGESRERRRRSPSPRRRDRSGSRRRDNKSRSSRSGSKARSRSRSRSPSVSEYKSRRKNKKSNFDVKPPVGEDGALILPPSVGAAPSAMFSGGNYPGAMSQMGVGGQQTRHARRLYVGGIGHDATEAEIAGYFNDIISRALGKPGDMPVMTVYINHERCFAFVELKTIELTTACMQLDGITYKGQTLRVRRPNDYNPSAVPPTGELPYLDLSFLGVISTTVPDGPSKVFVGGLPYNLTEDQVKELLSTFGQLKAFHLVRETGSLLSKGYGFCEYVNPAMTKLACEGLNGLVIGDKTLTVRVAATQSDIKGMSDAAIPGAYPSSSSHGASFDVKPPTRVLILYNMVTRQELENDLEYADIMEDVRQECERYGQVLSIVIPREKDGHRDAAIGRIFIEYTDPQSARTAGIALSGKKFGENLVQADYYSEEVYAAKRYAD